MPPSWRPSTCICIPLIIYSTEYIFPWYQVRSQGRDFSSLYWKDLSSSIFPLHAAVSNLCHCNPTSENGECVVLQNVIQCLSELGCNFNATDSIGNTALHIALSVCPERYFHSRFFFSYSLFIVISPRYHKYFSLCTVNKRKICVWPDMVRGI